MAAKTIINMAGQNASQVMWFKKPTPLRINIVPPMAQPNLRGAPCSGIAEV